MYAKLIFKNAKRSVKDYLIYIVTMTLCVVPSRFMRKFICRLRLNEVSRQ